MLLDQLKNPSFRIAIKCFLDACAFLAAWIVSYYIYFPADSVQQLIIVATLIPLFIIVELVSFAIFRQYTAMWRYSDLHVLEGILKAATLSTVVIVGITFFIKSGVLPISIMIINWMLVVLFSGGIRFVLRRVNTFDRGHLRNGNSGRRVLIYGAGQASELLLRNIENTKQADLNVIGLIDDDPIRQGQYIHGIRILGDRNKIGELVNKYQISDIIFSVPSLSGIEVRSILDVIRDQVGDRIEIRTMPGLTDLVDDRITINNLRKFEIKDLLRRKPVYLDHTTVQELIARRSVMVVGGGGSIGKELCIQIASFEPERLIIIDSCEFNLYNAESLLRELYPNLELVCLVADACKMKLMQKIFTHQSPEIVFHAAAYKHVPLMEMNPWAAVDNNLSCTVTLVELCREFDVKRFILISTDKAVQPTSVMGATKRMCEQISLLHKNNGSTEHIVVRFGNVLGSSGSVIPKFKSQIESGNPLTVTDPKITRYFMLISEAVELVLQAGAVGKNGNIYVLDMGEPINITDLAKYMIKLSGLRLDVDIKIEYTGLRPGEKLHESLYLEGEEKSTDVPNLLVLTPRDAVDQDYLDHVNQLLSKLYELDYKELQTELKNFVPEYQACLTSEHLSQIG
ncbi:MAG: nucleoside-diphosphate sugar epimerase/dehydratase [Candidatus Hatepunaea meridiana]|nr:nucleoside-diphosphate sugar epimerase/dehydratase [Candidatus Hatepunaea meridiana]